MQVGIQTIFSKEEPLGDILKSAQLLLDDSHIDILTNSIMNIYKRTKISTEIRITAIFALMHIFRDIQVEKNPKKIHRKRFMLPPPPLMDRDESEMNWIMPIAPFQLLWDEGMILNEEETNKLLDREKKGENLTWNKNEFIDWFGDSAIKNSLLGADFLGLIRFENKVIGYSILRVLLSAARVWKEDYTLKPFCHILFKDKIENKDQVKSDIDKMDIIKDEGHQMEQEDINTDQQMNQNRQQSFIAEDIRSIDIDDCVGIISYSSNEHTIKRITNEQLSTIVLQQPLTLGTCLQSMLSSPLTQRAICFVYEALTHFALPTNFIYKYIITSILSINKASDQDHRNLSAANANIINSSFYQLFPGSSIPIQQYPSQSSNSSSQSSSQQTESEQQESIASKVPDLSEAVHALFSFILRLIKNGNNIVVLCNEEQNQDLYKKMVQRNINESNSGKRKDILIENNESVGLADFLHCVLLYPITIGDWFFADGTFQSELQLFAREHISTEGNELYEAVVAIQRRVAVHSRKVE
ncbi:MAG: hypothetical protein EZS28_008271 [Streblomastix strix]|uniref:Uncharacterized protein n=1 Tax=Streblomastix strix TaxID=222440 RepID=A0A5J4WN44_9EUKA|nr:MAG: hypothetical protein EZS28_008271 [Streblomastix strix]